MKNEENKKYFKKTSIFLNKPLALYYIGCILIVSKGKNPFTTKKEKIMKTITKANEIKAQDIITISGRDGIVSLTVKSVDGDIITADNGQTTNFEITQRLIDDRTILVSRDAEIMEYFGMQLAVVRESK